MSMRKIVIGLAVAAAAAGGPAVAQAVPTEEGSEHCGRVVIDGKTENVWTQTAKLVGCPEAMSVANAYLVERVARPAKHIRVLDWECSGVTGGQLDEGARWNVRCIAQKIRRPRRQRLGAVER